MDAGATTHDFYFFAVRRKEIVLLVYKQYPHIAKIFQPLFIMNESAAVGVNTNSSMRRFLLDT